MLRCVRTHQGSSGNIAVVVTYCFGQSLVCAVLDLPTNMAVSNELGACGAT
jgi:hypothetical protein